MDGHWKSGTFQELAFLNFGLCALSVEFFMPAKMMNDLTIPGGIIACLIRAPAVDLTDRCWRCRRRRHLQNVERLWHLGRTKITVFSMFDDNLEMRYYSFSSFRMKSSVERKSRPWLKKVSWLSLLPLPQGSNSCNNWLVPVNFTSAN